MGDISGVDVVLGIETSCDETAASVVASGSTVLSSVVSSQIELHAPFGGVVPEVAGRAHLERIVDVIDQAVGTSGVQPAEIDAIAVTHGPGLVGALMVGVSAAKGLSMAWNRPLVGVNHLEAHLYAALLDDPDLEFPTVVLLVSGGHTLLVRMEGPGRFAVLGSTLDDAAGEAFDKVARFLDLGYPGGPVIDRLAAHGNAEAVRFPRPLPGKGLDFSFSGLKTGVVNHVRAHPELSTDDVAAAFQAAVVDVCVSRLQRAVAEVGAVGVSLAGGVAANSGLREAVASMAAQHGLACHIPSRAMCTDNAAMVAAAGWYRCRLVGASELSLGVSSSLRV